MASVSETIPLVDFAGALSNDLAARQAVAQAIGRAGRETGFFYLTGHGVPPALMAGQLEAARIFFAQPEDTKLALRLSNSPIMRGL